MCAAVLAAVLVVGTAALFPASAEQMLCGERAKILDHMATQYKESPVAIGLASNGAVLELLTSQAGKSWTIILSAPNGMTCLVMAGEEWLTLPVQMAGDDS